MTEVPQTESAWKSAAKKAKVYPGSIYGLELTSLSSASGIKEAQFLSLRTKWTLHPVEKFNQKDWGFKELHAARKELKNHPSDWKRYLAEVREADHPIIPVPNLGAFSLVWYNQQLVHTAKTQGGMADPKVTIRRSARLQNKNTGKVNPGDSPSPAPRQSIPDGEGLESRMSKLNLDLDTETPQGSPSNQTYVTPLPIALSPHSPASKEESRVLYPAVGDEQIVNVCLIDFLAAISFHSERIMCQWSIERKRFEFGEKDILYEARTDGYLKPPRDGPLGTRAIVEVKPYTRGTSYHIHFQETAQMAAWICSEPDEKSVGQDHFRVMISQDRHEMYLILAQYDDAYVNYLRDPKDPSAKSPLSLMTMHRFGPFGVAQPKEVEAFAEMIMTFMIQDGKLIF